MYFRSRRTAGLSLESALALYCGDEDFISKSNSYSGRNCDLYPTLRNHTNIKDVDVKGYTVIATVRNPWERVVSRYLRFCEERRYISFHEFLTRSLNIYHMPFNSNNQKLKPTGLPVALDWLDWYTETLDGAYDKVNMWVRYDHLKNDINIIEEKFQFKGLYETFKSFTFHDHDRPKITNLYKYFEERGCLEFVPPLSLVFQKDINMFEYKLYKK